MLLLEYRHQNVRRGTVVFRPAKSFTTSDLAQVVEPAHFGSDIQTSDYLLAEGDKRCQKR
jgi:hypothetical protein